MVQKMLRRRSLDDADDVLGPRLSHVVVDGKVFSLFNEVHRPNDDVDLDKRCFLKFDCDCNRRCVSFVQSSVFSSLIFNWSAEPNKTILWSSIAYTIISRIT